jgi:hypothetical protein
MFYICRLWGNCDKDDCEHMYRHEPNKDCGVPCQTVIGIHPSIRPCCNPCVDQRPLTKEEMRHENKNS